MATFPWARFFAWAGLIVGIFGAGRVMLISYPLFGIHHDIGIEGWIWFSTVCTTGFCTLLIGLPCAIIGIVKRRRLVGWLAVIFVVAPLPLGFAMLHITMALNGFNVMF